MCEGSTLLFDYLSTAWMVVTKWEKVEPTVHRTPIPEALLKAMISLAWCWGGGDSQQFWPLLSILFLAWETFFVQSDLTC